jgi:protocatechuate 3,4-dioxygenase beta subunit
MATPGCIWVYGTAFNYIGTDYAVHSVVGTLSGSPNGTPGGIWIYNNTLNYIDQTGAARTLPATFAIAGGSKSCVWVETTAAGRSNMINYIGSAGIYYVSTAVLGTLSGTVTDQTTGSPLSGAVVGLTGTGGTFSTSTQANGTYSITNIPLGYYTGSYSFPDYGTQTPGITIYAGENTKDVALIPGVTYGTVTGTVTDQTSGNPIAGATVVVSGTGGSYPTSSAGGSGIYTISNVPTGNYTLSCTYSGYSYTPTGIAVYVGTNNYPIGMTPVVTGTLSGMVTDITTGLGISGAYVSLGYGGSTSTGADGSFEIDSIQLGTYEMSVSAPTYSEYFQQVTIYQGANFAYPELTPQ